MVLAFLVKQGGITHQSLGPAVLGSISPRVKVYLGLRVLGFLSTRVHQSQCCPTLANPTSPWVHKSQGPLVLGPFCLPLPKKSGPLILGSNCPRKISKTLSQGLKKKCGVPIFPRQMSTRTSGPQNQWPPMLRADEKILGLMDPRTYRPQDQWYLLQFFIRRTRGPQD